MDKAKKAEQFKNLLEHFTKSLKKEGVNLDDEAMEKCLTAYLVIVSQFKGLHDEQVNVGYDMFCLLMVKFNEVFRKKEEKK